jgi:hypothetical protein
MLDDFHYYCVAVLARSAGFSKEDSLTIAYASQYVDDAKEHAPIRVGGMLFDPVRTAYLGLKAITWGIQKRVYIPYHFLPPKPIRSPKNTFTTEPDSKFAYKILKKASKESNYYFRLFRLGIALHTYADTWTHQGFSGRRNRENNVSRIFIWNGNLWQKKRIRSAFFNIGPAIGHFSVGLLPDIPYLKWKYISQESGAIFERDNPDIFIKASRRIYEFLDGIEKHSPDIHIGWKKLKPRLIKMFNTPNRILRRRCEMWREEFSDLFDPKEFVYDRSAWKEDALGTRKLIGEDIPTPFVPVEEFPKKKHFFETHWAMFHRAALKQRHYVLENLL